MNDEMLTSEGLARRIDLPSSIIRNAVTEGRLKPDATARAGRRLLVMFSPTRVEQIRMALGGKPQLATN